jgi:8-amino-7-oxononanoate synthase
MREFESFLGGEIDRLVSAGLLRHLRTVGSAGGPRVWCGGRELVNFSSNDYLGLASHPAVVDAARREMDGGFGAGASRLVCGTLAAHERLEEVIASFKRTVAALSFSSGYAAAMGTLPAVCGSGDVVILDKLCHACLVDAARLSGARIRIFPHNHLGKLDSHLRWARSAHPEARVLVVVESVYSMDGDLAPLREIVELKDRHGAWLFIDEAHGVGVLGAGGRGLAEAAGVGDRIEIQMGTLGKALGAHGAYVAGSARLREFLVNRARSFVFSTAPPAAVAAAATAAIQIVAGNEGDQLRERLWANIRQLTSGSSLAAESAIIPVIIGGETQVLEVAANLFEAGFLIPAIRFPTVAKGAARLRVTLSAAHSGGDIERLRAVLRATRLAPTC